MRWRRKRKARQKQQKRISKFRRPTSPRAPARIMILAVDAAVANSATSLAVVTHLAWRAACAAIKVKANEVVVYGGAFPIRD